MARDLKRVHTILTMAICISVGFSACDQTDRTRSANLPPSTDRPLTDVKRNSTPVEPVETPPDNDPPEVAAQSVDPPAPVAAPQQVFRPADRRPPHDDAKLKEAGIRIFESKRLKLYTDIDPHVAQTLPPLIDQIYAVWEEKLGPLPPDRAGTDFQISGYLIRDLALFRELELLPENLFLEHGVHLRNEFWMRDQIYDYYRRHLLIHEATHCFMTFMPGVAAPIWYLEGMAEYFASHRLNEQNQATFCVMPSSQNESAGFGRIPLIRDDVANHKIRSMESIEAFLPTEFTTTHHYAWSWALCAFLDGTPRYHDRFQSLAAFTHGIQFTRKFVELFKPDERDLATEWTLFSFNLQYGYDTVRAAIIFQSGSILSDEEPERTVQIESDRGWQSSQIRLEAGKSYEIAATGQFTLGDQPKPWLSEPQGITFRYFNGHPIGTLLGCIRTEQGPAGGEDDSMLRIITVGRGLKFQSAVTGTLYLRLNDAWNSLHDNRGHADATIHRIERP